MKSRKSIIAGAILSIMLCVSIVAGATFALFETKDEINVSVGSANVKITATIGDLETYSYDATENAQIKTAANGTFTAGGTATVGANGSLVLDRIAAGDKVTFNLNVKNESNIKTKWRTVVKCLNGRELYDGLAITLGGEAKSVTAYENLDVAPEGGETKTVAVSIELPYEAGTEFLNKNCELVVRAEAVQANAAITEVAEATEVKNSLANGGTTLLSSDIELTEAVTVAGGNATLDLNGNTLTMAQQIIVEDGNLNITNGKVVLTGIDDKNTGYDIRVTTGNSSVTVENSYIQAKKDAFFIVNDGNRTAPALVIKNSTVKTETGGWFCINTNAGSTENYNVDIEIENSTVIGGETAILFNIPGNLTVRNSTLISERSAVVLRAGNALIENTVIYGRSSTATLNYYNEKNWASGNEVTDASLVIGNRNGSYRGDATCVLKNVTVLRNGALEGSRTICISGGNTVDGVQYGASLVYDANCKMGVATDTDMLLDIESTEAMTNDCIYVDSKAPDKTKISINGTALN